VLLVPSIPALYGTLDVHLNHFRRYDPAGLRRLVSDAGFTVDIEPDAGLVARATPPTVEALRRDPAGLGNLGPLIGDLAALAAAEGVVPAPADLPAHQPSGGHGSSAR